jgi:hypothetical protein
VPEVQRLRRDERVLVARLLIEIPRDPNRV